MNSIDSRPSLNQAQSQARMYACFERGPILCNSILHLSSQIRLILQEGSDTGARFLRRGSTGTSANTGELLQKRVSDGSSWMLPESLIFGHV